jgi:hypothetical protein
LNSASDAAASDCRPRQENIRPKGRDLRKRYCSIFNGRRAQAPTALSHENRPWLASTVQSNVDIGANINHFDGCAVKLAAEWSGPTTVKAATA